jgi:aspartate/methionine/tyrosine aminotransferase
MDSDLFADNLLSDQKVAVAPGATFGTIAAKYVRVSLAASDAVVIEGLEKVCNFIKKNS